MDQILMYGVLPIFAAAVIGLILIPVFLRTVVPTNEVHIVQSSKRTTSYGKGMDSGNTYYSWPSWIPKIGVVKSKLTLSVFSIDLNNYEAYDSGRLPFMVDIKAFFRISDSGTAAERVNTFEELKTQLQSILQGAVRSILGKNDLESILSERGVFGKQFTEEVGAQLKQWGCETVKNIEFMDIRDSKESVVIRNIMEKKKSLIEMQSRIEVAENKKNAQIAETEATQAADIKIQEAEQIVGIRTAQKDQEIGKAKELAIQQVQQQAKITTEIEMSVRQVEQVRAAEIVRETQVVAADQEKQTTVIKAEGALEATKRLSEGIKIEGDARAEAEKLMQLAPVEAQIVLAKEIGGNDGYQNYLISIRTVEANQAVGIEQAGALKAAQIKIISNSGDPVSGVNNVMDLFSSKGGTSAGAMLEAFANTEVGAAMLAKFGITGQDAKGMVKEVEKEIKHKKTKPAQEEEEVDYDDEDFRSISDIDTDNRTK